MILKKAINEGDQRLLFLKNEKMSKGTLSYILGVKWLSGCSEVGDHEIYQKEGQVTLFYVF